MADAETGGEPAPAKQRRSCCGAIGRALWLVLCCVPRLVFYLLYGNCCCRRARGCCRVCWHKLCCVRMPAFTWDEHSARAFLRIGLKHEEVVELAKRKCDA